MTDGRHVASLSAGTRGVRPRLSLEDVVRTGLPAVFQDFGEQLVYRDGRIFDAGVGGRTGGDPIIVVDEAADAVGLEFGWRHASGCTCSSAAAATAPGPARP